MAHGRTQWDVLALRSITVSHCVQVLKEAGFDDAVKLLEKKVII